MPFVLTYPTCFHVSCASCSLFENYSKLTIKKTEKHCSGSLFVHLLSRHHIIHLIEFDFLKLKCCTMYKKKSHFLQIESKINELYLAWQNNIRPYKKCKSDIIY